MAIKEAEGGDKRHLSLCDVPSRLAWVSAVANGRLQGEANKKASLERMA